MKRGIYRTTYGNAAYVSGPSATRAYDLDSGEKIPISEVEERHFIRRAEPEDAQMARHASEW